MTYGWLNLDKPTGISSAQAIAQVKKTFGIKKAGHLGTLNPLASGVLPITLGKATKTIPYLSYNSKVHNFTIKFCFLASFQRVTLKYRKKEEWIVLSTTGMTEGNGVIVSNTKSFVIPIESALKAMFKIEISARRGKENQKRSENHIKQLA